MKPARELTSSRPKPCPTLKNSLLVILPVHRSLVTLVRKQTVARDQLSILRNLSARAQGFSTPLARRRSICPPPSPNLVVTHPIACATVRLRVVLLLPTRLSATVPPLLLACHHLPKGTKLELGEGAPDEHHPQPIKPPLPRLNRSAGS